MDDAPARAHFNAPHFTALLMGPLPPRCYVDRVLRCWTESQIRQDIVGAEELYKKAANIDPFHANSIYNYAVLLESSLKQHEVYVYVRCVKSGTTVDAPYKTNFICLLYGTNIFLSSQDLQVVESVNRFWATNRSIYIRVGRTSIIRPGFGSRRWNNCD